MVPGGSHAEDLASSGRRLAMGFDHVVLTR